MRTTNILLALSLGVVGCSAPDPSRSGGADGDDITNITVLPGGTETDSLLPPRIRRLTRAEYNAAVRSLLGTSLTPADDFPPDTRQHGYTTNEAQRVDPVLSRQLDSAAIALADEAMTQLDALAPCADPAGGGDGCALQFIESFASEAYRRPLDEEDRQLLLSLYTSGAEGADYAAGIHQVIRGILQSPGFLYLTEIGNGDLGGTVELADHEVAAAMSFLLTGGPPDDALKQAAAAGELSTTEGRRAHALRLLQAPDGGERVVRLVREWLFLDQIETTAKDSNVYPDYVALQPAMAEETGAFVKETLSTGGLLTDLLGASWTVASADLAAMYGASGEGRVELPERRGLLNQGAFLSVKAHANETAPILRGVAVMRRLGCFEIEIPELLAVDIVPPEPDPTKTTRQRFDIHSQDAGCASCHTQIDPLGFAFEHYDGMGASQTEENGLPIDSAVTVAVGHDYDGSYEGSNDLAVALSQSENVAECFARQMYRAQSAEGVGAERSEEQFLTEWQSLSDQSRRSAIDILATIVASESFAFRRAQ